MTKQGINPRCSYSWVLLLTLLLAAAQHVTADTTVQHSYWERLEDAMYAFIGGCCLLLFSICMLVGTERQAIAYDVLLSRCQQATIIINDNNTVNSLNEFKPVFLSGETRLEPPSSLSSGHGGHDSDAEKGFARKENIVDTDTGYRCCTKQVAMRLKRRVEMYQWVEHKKKEEKETHYTYSMEWRESDVSSSQFQESYSHINPPRSPYLQSTSLAHSFPVVVGAYMLANKQIDLMQHYYSCPIPSSSLEASRRHSNGHVEQDFSFSSASVEPEAEAGGSGGAAGGYQSGWGRRQTQTDFLVFNGDLRQPHQGTVRVSYEALVEGGEVSVLGVQQQQQRQLQLPPFRPFLPSDAQAREPWFLTYIFKALSGDCSCTRQPSSYTSANYELDPRDRQGGDSGGGAGAVCCLPCKVCCCCCYALSSCASVFSKAVVGDSVFLLEERCTTVGSLFNNERIQLSGRLLLMRLGGCFLLSLSIYLIFNPIAVILSFIPYLSGLLSKAFWVASLLLGFTAGALIIASSWVLYRPLYFGVLSLTLGLASLFLGPVGEGDEGIHVAGVFFLTAGVLALLLAVLYAIDSWQYSAAVEEERSSRPVGQLEVTGAGAGTGTSSYYTEATAVTVPPTASSVPPSVPSAPPAMSYVKMQAMGIE